MLMALNDQIRLLVSNIFTGIIIGMLFDIYRLVRGDINNKILGLLEDILFWILAGFIVFYFMMITNDAYLSIYSVLFIFIGIYIHICFISKMFYALIKNLMEFTFKMFRIAINTVIYPFQCFFVKKKTKKHWNFKSFTWTKDEINLKCIYS